MRLHEKETENHYLDAMRYVREAALLRPKSLLGRLAWIRKHGLKAYLTWATMDEAAGKVPLSRRTRFWRWVFQYVFTTRYYCRVLPWGTRLPWWMGVAYLRHHRNDGVAVLLPLNVLVGAVYRLWLFTLDPWWQLGGNPRLMEHQHHRLTHDASRFVTSCTCGARVRDLDMICPAMIDAMARRRELVISSSAFKLYNDEKERERREGGMPGDSNHKIRGEYRNGYDAGYAQAMTNQEKHIGLRACAIVDGEVDRMLREGTERVKSSMIVNAHLCPDGVHEWGAWYQPDERVNETKRIGEGHRRCARCGRVERGVDHLKTNSYLDPEYVKQLQSELDPKQYERELMHSFCAADPARGLQATGATREEALEKLEKMRGGHNPATQVCEVMLTHALYERIGEARLPKRGEFYEESDGSVWLANRDFENNHKHIMRKKVIGEQHGYHDAPSAKAAQELRATQAYILGEGKSKREKRLESIKSDLQAGRLKIRGDDKVPDLRCSCCGKPTRECRCAQGEKESDDGGRYGQGTS